MDECDSGRYYKPIFDANELRVTSIISNHRISHFDGSFSQGKTNLLASSQDDKLIFLAVKDSIYVYPSADFSSNNPPDPSSFFPFNPLLVLRPTPNQISKISARSSTRIEPGDIVFNHIRVGWIGNFQESLVAVGEFGTILVWNVGKLDDGPVLLEGSNDFESTWGIAISPNNFLIATSSNAHAVTIFHFPSRKVIYTSVGSQLIHVHNIPCLDFSPCGRWLASCSIDGHIAVWSLIHRQVTRFHSKKDAWGWLVRFVSPKQYTHIGKTVHLPKNTKRFYTSDIKDDTENDSPYDDMETYGFQDDEDEDYELDVDEVDEDEYDFDEESDYESEQMRESRTVHNNPSIDATQIVNELLTQINSNNEDGVHLAAGAGDTWATDPEDEPEDSERIWTKDDGSEFDESESEGSFTLSTSELIDFFNSECSSEFGDPFSSDCFDTGNDNEDTDNYNEDSDYDSEDSEYAGRLDSVKFEIKFINTESLSLFTSVSTTPASDSLTCPYDIFYCTRESFSIISPSDQCIKARIKDLPELCMIHQNIPKGPYSNIMIEVFLKRLCMGEWLDELSTFLVIDSFGHLIALSPKVDAWRSQTFDPIFVPDVRRPRSEIVGYTTVKKVDAEYGVKVHVYLVCADGTFRLYEVVKTVSLL